MRNWNYPKTANSLSTRHAEDAIGSRYGKVGPQGYFNNSEERCKALTVLNSEDSGGFLPEGSC